VDQLHPFGIGQLHELSHLVVEILFTIHAKVMIELLLAGHLRDLLKTEIVRISLFERKDNMNKVLTYLCDVAYPFCLEEGLPVLSMCR
jgi:hypothetical protein